MMIPPTVITIINTITNALMATNSFLFLVLTSMNAPKACIIAMPEKFVSIMMADTVVIR